MSDEMSDEKRKFVEKMLAMMGLGTLRPKPLGTPDELKAVDEMQKAREIAERYPIGEQNIMIWPQPGDVKYGAFVEMQMVGERTLH